MTKHSHSDEKLMTAYYKAVEFFEANKKHIYTALTIVVIAVAGIIILVNRNKANNENAGVALTQIKNAYDNNDFTKAIYGDTLNNIKGLQYIVDEFGSTENGELAKIMLAHCYYNLREFDKALNYYKDYSGSNKMLEAASIAGEASVDEAQQKYLDAARLYEKAAGYDKSNHFNDQYLFYAGKNYVKADEKESAKKVFDRIKEDYPKSKYVTEAEKYKSVVTSNN